MNFDSGDVTNVMNHPDVLKVIAKLVGKLEAIEKAVKSVEGKLFRFQPYTPPNYQQPYTQPPGAPIQPGWPPQPYCTYSNITAESHPGEITKFAEQ